MSHKEIMFVVGAGASQEVEIPTGDDIKDNISTILDFQYRKGPNLTSGDKVVYGSMIKHLNSENRFAEKIGDYIEASRLIRDAMPQASSIDNFIDQHRGNAILELCGKLAIVKSILDAEKGSTLSFDKNNIYNKPDFSHLTETWFAKFWQLLTNNCTAEQLEVRLSSIGLVVFNYDRCIEHFLYYSLQNYYKMASERAAELVRGIELFHPYGTVGDLPWFNGEASIDFGEKPNSKKLLELAGQVKTFSEGTDPESSDIERIRNAMAESDKIVFLGFAFHGQNLELIKSANIDNPRHGGALCYGTAYGISESDRQIIVKEIASVCRTQPNQVFLKIDLTCAQLFKEFRKGLSFP